MLKRKLDRNSKSVSSVNATEEKKAKSDENSESQSLDLSFSNCCQADKSKYFPNHQHSPIVPESTVTDSIDDAMLKVQNALNEILRTLKFRSPVEYVYNPVEYASKCNEAYIRKYCNSLKKLLFVGMNPGPFGMCQTGVPFGEIKSVRDWLGITAEVSKPAVECPERPVLGFECTRTEISGDRLWNLFKDICGTPNNLFRSAFVYNYCPLAFMKSNGGNVTPSELKNAKELEEICDESYLKVIKLLQPKTIICIGRYVEKRTNLVLKDTDLDTEVLFMPHPSPRSVNNQNWPEKAKQFLLDNNLTTLLNTNQE